MILKLLESDKFGPAIMAGIIQKLYLSLPQMSVPVKNLVEIIEIIVLTTKISMVEMKHSKWLAQHASLAAARQATRQASTARQQASAKNCQNP